MCGQINVFLWFNYDGITQVLNIYIQSNSSKTKFNPDICFDFSGGLWGFWKMVKKRVFVRGGGYFLD